MGKVEEKKFLFIAKMVIEHNNLDLTPYDINKYFNEPYKEPSLTKEINKHDRKDYKGEFNKVYLERSHRDLPEGHQWLLEEGT